MGKKTKEAQDKKSEDSWIGLGYRKKDVVSTLIKEMRLGNLERVYYWYMVLREAKEPYSYIGNILIRFTWEDCYGMEIICYSGEAWRAWMATKGKDENIIYSWLEKLTRAEKFWESDAGRYRERVWWEVEDRIEKNGFTLEIPPYALDRHSTTGWRIQREGGSFDERFSGTREGRLNMCAAFERDGKLDPEGKPALKDK